MSLFYFEFLLSACFGLCLLDFCLKCLRTLSCQCTFMSETLKHFSDVLCKWVNLMTGGLYWSVIKKKISFSLWRYSNVSICKSFLCNFWVSLEKELQFPAKRCNSGYGCSRSKLGGNLANFYLIICVQSATLAPPSTKLGVLTTIISLVQFLQRVNVQSLLGVGIKRPGCTSMVKKESRGGGDSQHSLHTLLTNSQAF